MYRRTIALDLWPVWFMMARSLVAPAIVAEGAKPALTVFLQDLGQRALSSLTRKELQAHLDRHADELVLSASVVGHVRWQLKAIFEMAEADQLVAKSPANGLVMPHCKDAPAKRTITPDDVLRAQVGAAAVRAVNFSARGLRRYAAW